MRLSVYASIPLRPYLSMPPDSGLPPVLRLHTKGVGIRLAGRPAIGGSGSGVPVEVGIEQAQFRTVLDAATRGNSGRNRDLAQCLLIAVSRLGGAKANFR